MERAYEKSVLSVYLTLPRISLVVIANSSALADDNSVESQSFLRMGFIIGFVIFFGGFYAMSRAFKALFLLVLLLFIGYGFIHSDYFGSGFRNEESVIVFFSIASLVVGVFLLGVVLGVVRHNSSTNEVYCIRRTAIFKFLAFWSVLYAVYFFLGEKIIYYFTDDKALSYFSMKMYGGKVFFALLVIFFLFRYKIKK